MKLQVRPVYGWGWYNIKGDAVDVPAPFEFDATIIEPDNPDELFTVASATSTMRNIHCRDFGFSCRSDTAQAMVVATCVHSVISRRFRYVQMHVPPSQALPDSPKSRKRGSNSGACAFSGKRYWLRSPS